MGCLTGWRWLLCLEALSKWFLVSSVYPQDEKRTLMKRRLVERRRNTWRGLGSTSNFKSNFKFQKQLQASLLARIPSTEHLDFITRGKWTFRDLQNRSREQNWNGSGAKQCFRQGAEAFGARFRSDVPLLRAEKFKAHHEFANRSGT